jgi:hypothetical protein
MVRITQVPESPRSLSISIDLNFPLNGVPHWMTETLAGSTLMKEAYKCSETLQEYRSGYENPMGEVSDSDLKQISLDLSFTELQDVPYGSKTSQSADKCRMMINLQKSTQTDDPTPSEALDGDGMRLEWCGGVFHPQDQVAEQGEWVFHH